MLKQENVECLKQANRVIKKAIKEKSQISQGNYIHYLVENNDKYMPIAWQSKCIRRVVKNTLTAETLAILSLYFFIENSYWRCYN